LVEKPDTPEEIGRRSPEGSKTTNVPNIRPKSAVKFDLAQLGLRRKRYENNTGCFEDFSKLESLFHKELKIARTLLRSNTEEYLLTCEAYISKESKERKLLVRLHFNAPRNSIVTLRGVML